MNNQIKSEIKNLKKKKNTHSIDYTSTNMTLVNNSLVNEYEGLQGVKGDCRHKGLSSPEQ